jgi:predicted Zn finger-like uncharacterized protein
MTYLTQCPACGTVFRLLQEHLDARHGFVRCGQCSKVFDARLTLAEEAFEESASAVPADGTATPRTELETEIAEPAVELSAIEPIPEVLPPEPQYSLADAPGEETFDFGPERLRRERRRVLAWGAGSALLLALLGAQAAWFYRSELAVQLPEAKPWLEAMCARLGCTVPPPQHASLLSIEASELQIEKGVPGLLTLSLTLRNRATFAQAHPALELTLTDAEDRAIARRVLLPRDYLGERLAREPVFPAASEYALKLNLDTTPLRPGGYRVFVFYP